MFDETTETFVTALTRTVIERYKHFITSRDQCPSNLRMAVLIAAVKEHFQIQELRLLLGQDFRPILEKENQSTSFVF